MSSPNRERTVECGCRCTPSTWTKLCARHQAEHGKLHAQAQRDYQRHVGVALSATPAPRQESAADNSDLL